MQAEIGQIFSQIWRDGNGVNSLSQEESGNAQTHTQSTRRKQQPQAVTCAPKYLEYIAICNTLVSTSCVGSVLELGYHHHVGALVSAVQ